VVVAVGLLLVDPLADEDANVPGVMAILVAPDDAQLSVLLVPELMVVGFAVKEVIVGVGPFPGAALVEPQPTSTTQTDRTRTSAQRSGPEEWSFRGPILFLRNQSVDSMQSVACLRAEIS
jgi:hypothetical protein